MPHVKPDIESVARIKVVGVGGSGKNAVNHMVRSKVRGVEFIAINTDAQDLHQSSAHKKIRIGRGLTKGLGTGMNTDIGRQAAEETKDEINEALKGADMIFVTCGMGGGTGTGAAPIVAQIAKSNGALTIGVITRPFSFEGLERTRVAEAGIVRFREAVDAMIAIPNDKLLSVIQKDTPLLSAFSMCDEVLRQAVEGISDLITVPGIINVDIADVRAVMQNAGSALMGIGSASGEKRAWLLAQLPFLDAKTALPEILKCLDDKDFRFQASGISALTRLLSRDRGAEPGRGVCAGGSRWRHAHSLATLAAQKNLGGGPSRPRRGGRCRS